MEEKVEQNGNFIRDIVDFSKRWVESKKEKKKGDKYYMETYLKGVNILFSDDCCVVKAKCYCSTRRAEAPHERRIVFDNCEEGFTEVTTQCFSNVNAN